MAGAHEIVILPAERSVLAAAVRKAVARVATEAQAAAARSPLVVVLGPKGGVGKTTVATNLATTLVQRGRRTLLIDLDLQFGDVGLVLGVHPDRTIHDLVAAQGRLDGDRLRGFVGGSADGVDVLLAPARPDQADAVTPERLTELLDVARREYDVVVVDTPPAFTSTTITAIDHAQHAVMVGTHGPAGPQEHEGGARDALADGVPARSRRHGPQPQRLQGRPDRPRRQADPHTTPDVNVPSDRSVPQSLNAARPIVAERRRRPRKGVARARRARRDGHLELADQGRMTYVAHRSPLQRYVAPDGAAGRRSLPRSANASTASDRDPRHRAPPTRLTRTSSHSSCTASSRPRSRRRRLRSPGRIARCSRARSPTRSSATARSPGS